MSNCLLCGRELDKSATKHHLVPKAKKGINTETVLLHNICHQAIHMNFSNTELARTLNSIEALLKEPAIQKFIKWVKKKPIHFAYSTKARRN